MGHQECNTPTPEKFEMRVTGGHFLALGVLVAVKPWPQLVAGDSRLDLRPSLVGYGDGGFLHHVLQAYPGYQIVQEVELVRRGEWVDGDSCERQRVAAALMVEQIVHLQDKK